MNQNSTPSNCCLFPQEEIYNLDEIEKRTIIKALKKCNFNKSDAAKLLHIEWNALYRRIQKHGITFENE